MVLDRVREYLSASATFLLDERLETDRPQPLDHELVRLLAPLLDAMGRYFRGEVLGLERMPEGPALLVSNHNAGITSFEPLLLGWAWHQRAEGRDPLYYLAHDAVIDAPLLGQLLARLGTVRACQGAGDRVLAAGRKVLVFPGGNYEAFRPFWKRHRVDFHGRTGFAKLALRHRVPIVPVLSLGGHETFFVVHRGERLAKLLGVKRFLRSDSFPLFFGLPWGVCAGPLFHLPLPAKLLVEVGEPLRVDHYPEDAADDEDLARQLAERTELAVQELMDKRAPERRPFIG